jgi:glycosyltransferase involved in cell wall biosynthesis
MDATGRDAPMMKLGLLGFGLVEWGGGKDMLRQFMAALAAVQKSRALDVTVLLPDATPEWPQDLRVASLITGLPRPGALRQLKRVRWALQERSTARRRLEATVHELRTAVPGRFSYRICRDFAGLRATCTSLQLDALLACVPDLGAGFPVPWCGYLPDVQHRRLPHMFSPAEIKQRDAHFSGTLANADAMLATSRAVAHDLGEFFGEPRHCTVLPMAWLPLVPPDAADAHRVAARYGITGRYFIVCNQFWRHKDHETAFRAFAAISRSSEGKGLTLVCTGDTGDYRHKDHFTRMTALLGELEIAPQVHILGRIPKEDQLALLHGAVALIQPSLFEGTRGGLAVADALALARPCIVSDIPVNRELDEPGVWFFQVGNEQDLFRQMRAMLADAPATRERVEQQRVCAERMHALGESLVSAATAARAARKAKPTLPSRAATAH